MSSTLRSQSQGNLLKAIDSASNDFRHLAERWHNRLSGQGQSLAERYMRHGLTVVCDLAISVPDASVGMVVGRNENPIVYRKFLASIVYSANVSDARYFEMGNQQPVFVSNVETVKAPDGLAIPSLVRLYDIHDETENFCAGVIFQSAIYGVLKPLAGVVNGELGVRSGNENKLMHGVIESGAESGKGIAQDEQERVWKGLSRFDCDQIASGLQVMIDVNNVSVLSRELRGLEVEVIDVMFGPFNL
jgi:hypothetical protein